MFASKLARRLIGVVLAASTFLGVSASSASAWSGSPSGSPGTVYNLGTLSAVDVVLFGNPYFSFMGNRDYNVARTPVYAGTQLVVIQWFVDRWNSSTGRWDQVYAGPLARATLPSGRNALFARPNLQTTVARGYLRPRLGVVWARADTGGFLAGTSIVPSAAAETPCVTTTRLCLAYNGYVRLGGYLTGAW